MANKILESLSTQPYTLSTKQELHVGASIGISFYPQDGDTPEILLKNADNALYQAKDAGRNTYKTYTTGMHLQASARMLLENGLRKAVDKNELVLYYQPILSMSTEKIMSAEALLRWDHPIKGIILPSEFIPLAEETGLISRVGEWVIRSVFQQVRQWKDEDIKHPVISLNISPRQFDADHFADFVISCAQEYNISSNCIQLEITESLAMGNIADSIPKLRALKSAGFRIAIDDFGSGYSSLSYLKELPLDVLKIDRSFTKENTPKSRDETIVQAIIALGHSLSLEVCAEGIETSGQYDFFKNHNCDTVQGFFVAKPKPVSLFMESSNERF